MEFMESVCRLISDLTVALQHFTNGKGSRNQESINNMFRIFLHETASKSKGFTRRD